MERKRKRNFTIEGANCAHELINGSYAFALMRFNECVKERKAATTQRWIEILAHLMGEIKLGR